MSDRGPINGGGNPLQQLDTDVQKLVGAVNRVATAIEALVPPAVAVSGSRASGAALQSLLTGLAAAGIIVDGTTP